MDLSFAFNIHNNPIFDSWLTSLCVLLLNMILSFTPLQTPSFRLPSSMILITMLTSSRNYGNTFFLFVLETPGKPKCNGPGKPKQPGTPRKPTNPSRCLCPMCYSTFIFISYLNIRCDLIIHFKPHMRYTFYKDNKHIGFNFILSLQFNSLHSSKGFSCS